MSHSHRWVSSGSELSGLARGKAQRRLGELVESAQQAGERGDVFPGRPGRLQVVPERHEVPVDGGGLVDVQRPDRGEAEGVQAGGDPDRH